MRVLHFYNGEGSIGAVRLQRFVQSDLNMGIQAIVFVKNFGHGVNKKLKRAPSPWIPGMKKVSVECYKRSRQLSYLLPTAYDRIGLKRVFQKYRCDFVHAHNVPAAYYSYRLGLPTLYNDWEYYYEYFNHQPKALGIGLRPVGSALLSYARRIRAKKIVGELIRNLPVIVTNDEVGFQYRELGATSIWWVPNVPLSYEKEYAFAIDVAKNDRITTCYVGDMSVDNSSILRNTSGVRKLWSEHNIGNLLVLEGKNHVPHLGTLRKLRECHFNLLYWKPLPVHIYFLQNKAFLASVVGVPTIISSSLKATIRLLGEYALPVHSLEDIPKVIKTYDYSRKYRFNPAHIWEYHQRKIRAAYKEALRV